jgi:hypothetical protein
MCTLTILTAVIPSAHASTMLLTISGDPNNFFVPELLSSVDVAATTVTNGPALGGGSLGFNGGLTTGPGGALYGIANDSTGAGSLYTIQLAGSISLVGSVDGLGFGYLGGLAFDAANSTFYAAVNDQLGNTTLSSITTAGLSTPLGQNIGVGFSGLAYDSSNGLFFGISNDINGLSQLWDFTLGGSPNLVASLGYGYGALTYDPTNDVFWAISPVNNASSELIEITASGIQTNQFVLGDGFVEMAVAQSSATTPEPGSIYEALAGCLLIAWKIKAARTAPADPD